MECLVRRYCNNLGDKWGSLELGQCQGRSGEISEGCSLNRTSWLVGCGLRESMAPDLRLGDHIGGWWHHSWSGECGRRSLCVLRGLCSKTTRVGWSSPGYPVKDRVDHSQTQESFWEQNLSVTSLLSVTLVPMVDRLNRMSSLYFLKGRVLTSGWPGKSPLFLLFWLRDFALAEEKPSKPASTGVTVSDWPLCQREMGIRHSLTSRLSGHRSRCEQIVQVSLVHRGIMAEEQGTGGSLGQVHRPLWVGSYCDKWKSPHFPCIPTDAYKELCKTFLKRIILFADDKHKVQ